MQYGLLIILRHFILVHISTPFSILSYKALYNIMFCSFLMTHKSTQTFFRQSISIHHSYMSVSVFPGAG